MCIRDRSIPDSLSHQIELFRETGRVVIYDKSGFMEPSFIAIMMGLGIKPKTYDPFVDLMDIASLRRHFASVHKAIALTVGNMSDHTDYIDRHVSA